jgi:hypothetical protein
MSNYEVISPIAMLIFNRPETTAQVFGQVAAARPRRLLLIADGPRPDRPEEAERCAAARAIAERVDWPCEVSTNYSDVNLGCRKRVSSGLNWVFEQVGEAIVLEDDCVPHPTFFRFCDELLERYSHDERVMAISGTNFQLGHSRTSASYYFSRFSHVWGWASWRRAWRFYDVNLELWPSVRDARVLKDLLPIRGAQRYWQRTLQATHDGQINTWDFQWTFACWIQHGLVAIPDVNLVSNIGFSEAATHTKGGSPFAGMPAYPLAFPLRHPAFMLPDVVADTFTQRNVYYDPALMERIKARSKAELDRLARRMALYR